MLRVEISNHQQLMPIPRAHIRRVARSLAPPSWDDAAISIVFVADDLIRALNERFLKRSCPTDVLAFPLETEQLASRARKRVASRPQEPRIVGEVIVSTERALEEARRRNVNPQAELMLYVVHGILHLLGCDDHSEHDRGIMYTREKQALLAAGYPYVRYAERASRAKSR